MTNQLTVTVTVQNETTTPVLSEAEIAELALPLLAQANLTGAWLIDCRFVSLATMATLNSEAQGYDEPTDVLSFPVHFATNEADPHRVLPRDTPQLLGSIVVSPDVAATQAAERGHDTPTELKELVRHSVYHLLGNDHDDNAQWLPRQTHQDFDPRTDVVHG